MIFEPLDFCRDFWELLSNHRCGTVNFWYGQFQHRTRILFRFWCIFCLNFNVTIPKIQIRILRSRKNNPTSLSNNDPLPSRFRSSFSSLCNGINGTFQQCTFFWFSQQNSCKSFLYVARRFHSGNHDFIYCSKSCFRIIYFLHILLYFYNNNSFSPFSDNCWSLHRCKCTSWWSFKNRRLNSNKNYK